MSKLTIPSPQNIKRREAFLFAHPDYYPEAKLKSELLKIAFIRMKKNLRWEQPKISLPQTPSEEFKPLPVEKKVNLFKRVINLITQRGK